MLMYYSVRDVTCVFVSMGNSCVSQMDFFSREPLYDYFYHNLHQVLGFAMCLLQRVDILVVFCK